MKEDPTGNGHGDPPQPGASSRGTRFDRRAFLLVVGRGLCAATVLGTAARVLFGKDKDAQYEQPWGRFAWQIDPDKCTFCTKCATACVRRPSAVKAVNDETKCSNCVVCYGHIYNHSAPSDRIEQQPKVCPLNAVRRIPFAGGRDGYYLYEIDQEICNGCGACARECNALGTKSMFLVIRPDLCLGCTECAIVKACPSGAVIPLPQQGVTDFREFLTG